MSPAGAWIIANPQAGGGRALQHGSVVARILRDGGVSCRLLHPSTATQTREAAAQAVREGVSAVIACGGDGTVHDVLQSVVGSDVPLGIVAAGSGDDVAGGLGLVTAGPEDSGRALLQALRSRDAMRIDVGAVSTVEGESRYFIGVLSTGFDSSVNERANGMRRLAGQRYNVAIMRELASFRPLPYVVTLDGQAHTGEGMLVSVGNGPRYGGGMLVCPSARPDDGELDVTWLGPLTKTRFLRLFPRVYRGTHVQDPSVTTYRARELTIDAPGQVAYADGERIGALPVSVRVLPGAVAVLRSTAAALA